MRESMLAHIHINTCMSMLEFVLHKVSVLSSLCEKDRNRVCLLVCVCVCMRVLMDVCVCVAHTPS